MWVLKDNMWNLPKKIVKLQWLCTTWFLNTAIWQGKMWRLKQRKNSYVFLYFLACECNGWTSRCRFNEYYYSLTGRGGECLECDGHRDGQHCERCKPNHFFSPNQDDQGRIPCEPCNCDSTGMSYRLSQQVLNEFVLTLETILHFHFKCTCVLIWLRLETTPMCSGWQMRM